MDFTIYDILITMNSLKTDFIYKQYLLQTFLIRHGMKDLFANGVIPSKKDLEDLWTNGEIMYGVVWSNCHNISLIDPKLPALLEICRDWQDHFVNILPMVYMNYYA